MIVSEIKLYNLLKAKIGDQEAEAFIQILEEKVDQKFEDKKDVLATKGDISNVKEDVLALKEDLARQEARLTMRMFLFWIGQVGAFIAIVKFLM